MKRWPRVMLPERMPSTSKGTISGSSRSEPKVQTIEWSGRTQRKLPVPQRCDFGQGKVRIVVGTSSARTSDRLAAGLQRLGDVVIALLVGDDGRLIERGDGRRP